MRRKLFACAAVFGLALGTAAHAQMMQDEVDLGDDEVVTVREFVTRQALPPVLFKEPGQVRPGSIIPDDIALTPFSEAPVKGLARYAYFVSPDDKIVVVDPVSRVVVRILSR